jgi:hypothetical protein
MVSDDQIVALLNEAQTKMCMQSYLLMTCATTSTVASQESYSVPSDFIKIEAVFIYNTTSGQKQRLRPIDLMKRDPTKSTGSPQYYFIWGLNVSSVNSFTVNLNPIPSTSGTSDLEIYFRQAPLTMVSGGQAPEIPGHFQYALVAYALWKIWLRDQSAIGANLASSYKREWDEWVHEAESFINPLTLDMPQQIDDAMGMLNPY